MACEVLFQNLRISPIILTGNIESNEKITKSSKAVMKLEKKVKNCEISLSDNGKSVSEAELVFIKNKMGNDRTELNRLNAAEEENYDMDSMIFWFFT